VSCLNMRASPIGPYVRVVRVVSSGYCPRGSSAILVAVESSYVAIAVVVLVVGGNALLFLMLHLRVQRIASDTGPPVIDLGVVHAQGVLPIERTAAYPLAVEVLERLGGTLIGQPSEGLIRSQRGLLQYGQIVSIWLTPLPEGTWFTVESRPKALGPLDSSRGRRVVAEVVEALTAARAR
jgi:hypothetical protein